MNWRTIEDSWNEFALMNQSELKQEDRNYFHGITTKYQIDYVIDNYSVSLKGSLSKNSSGINRNHSTVIFKGISIDKKVKLRPIRKKYRSSSIEILDDAILIKFKRIFQKEDFELIKPMLTEFGMG